MKSVLWTIATILLTSLWARLIVVNGYNPTTPLWIPTVILTLAWLVGVGYYVVQNWEENKK